MKKYVLPTNKDWEEICSRPELNSIDLSKSVERIMDTVRDNGDSALLDLAKKYDNCTLQTLQVSEVEKEKACEAISDDLKNAISLAKANIEKFHAAQMIDEERIQTMQGVSCWRKSVGIEKVGLYIPGGSAPLFSTVLMLGVPAKLAGCKEIILTTPPSGNGSIAPEIIYTAQLIGIEKMYKVGGAQAIAALSYGTESIPQVSKIFGPGNQFVTKAKELAQVQGVAIDMPAGPSEVLVIADDSCSPEFVAADLLSQAEHGADSQVILVTTNESILDKVEKELYKQLDALPRKDIANASLQNSRMVVCESIKECVNLSNYYAPEHLILASDEAENWLEDIVNAGSVFIGNYSCESAGDYASGTNHTLPTNGYAKNYSGVSIDSFVRKITFQKLTKQGLKNIGLAIELMAEAEQLMAHKNAVSIRLKK
jgi:histidinol dehydrogenase